MREKMRNKKGFTLAELLIVVAIIAVLTAIAIPVFTTQLEKSREATDLANIRSAYAECMTAYLSGDAAVTAEVELTQTQDGWKYVPKDEGKVYIGTNITAAGSTTGRVEVEGATTTNKAVISVTGGVVTIKCE